MPFKRNLQRYSPEAPPDQPAERGGAAAAAASGSGAGASVAVAAANATAAAQAAAAAAAVAAAAGAHHGFRIGGAVLNPKP